MFNVKRLAKYLATGEMTALDESLAEHDRKYHTDGYKEGDRCNKREGMAWGDGVDKVVPSETGDGKRVTEGMSGEYAARQLSSVLTNAGIDERQINEILSDGAHEWLRMSIQDLSDMKQINRALADAINDWMDDLKDKVGNVDDYGYDIRY